MALAPISVEPRALTSSSPPLIAAQLTLEHTRSPPPGGERQLQHIGRACEVLYRLDWNEARSPLREPQIRLC